ncbi:MAG: thioredoxin domain-containing protein [Cytophagales bacterium]|nr:MAG: thioredoxin domain-containing protein [Cytophagales bacterium]TAF61948.1 MAG: thioredoxin domain-containing protein [Cytophagales bacterium]
MQTAHKKPNRLSTSTSPYLLQHAYNPVDWYPWGDEALKKAADEDKLILLSIGYSACHWCHVMERECFENEVLARYMNEHFVCIKVDREERPDIDQLYLDAASAMGSATGWPLNMFLLPNHQPIYGGTYFTPEQWQSVLEQLQTQFKNQRNKLDDIGQRVTQYLNVPEVLKYKLETREVELNYNQLNRLVALFSKKFDEKNGGFGSAPKFPMPVAYLFLLRYYKLTLNTELLNFITFSLDSMARGGIYDQVGGGFSRYSTDNEWFEPHFEKMLYDNAQLVSVYSEAYSLTKDPLYKEVVYDTIAFVKREMFSREGGFYSAIDADSEGVEGKYYVFSASEIDEIIGSKDAALCKKFFGIEEKGNWKEGFTGNILFRTQSEEDFAEQNGIKYDIFVKKISTWKGKLLKARKQFVKPGIDDKIITSWNALMIKGLCDAYMAFGEEEFLTLALRNATFLEKRLAYNVAVFHTYKNKQASIPGFMDDYACLIQAYIALFQVTHHKHWLFRAENMTHYVMGSFFTRKDSLFAYRDSGTEPLIATKKEIFDNVMPASNSVMAQNLHFLSYYLNNDHFKKVSRKMLTSILPLFLTEPRYVTNWATLFTYNVLETTEVTVVGSNALEVTKAIQAHYFPNKVVTAVIAADDSEQLKGKQPPEGKTAVYVCRKKTCMPPVFSVEEAIDAIDYQVSNERKRKEAELNEQPNN